ncbi:hypothetical protein CR194_13170 [Salipaludibacillus keqinensis]|uniref:Uncharacterized protein n=1 Tax=Salipaludibacillus keqinensis TaxID=2045207 RepID=A0A323TDA2_9BACI|nr:hypothetical protein [Salipaludibacillus keqinensis]PYZ92616.1 hypothetical protein CR194_13170 [Salipaludibacillus keqinensis]
MFEAESLRPLYGFSESNLWYCSFIGVGSNERLWKVRNSTLVVEFSIWSADDRRNRPSGNYLFFSNIQKSIENAFFVFYNGFKGNDV